MARFLTIPSKLNFIDNANTILIKLFGVFVSKHRSTTVAPPQTTIWLDHLQWSGGRYLNPSEINALQAKFSSTENC